MMLCRQSMRACVAARHGLVAIVLGVMTSTASAEVPDDATLLAQARDVIAKVGIATFITVDGTGQPRSRAVDAFAPDEDFTVWVATRPVTRKVEEIRNHPAVTLYWFDAEGGNYVTLMGTATLVTDEATKRRMRRPQDGARFYPDFPADYLLIRVDAQRLEMLVPAYRGDPQTWRPAVVDLDPR